VLAQKAAIWSKEQHGAVESATVPFNYPDDKIDAVASRGPAKLLNCWAGYVNAALPISAEVFAAFLRPRTNHRAEVESPRIGGDKRFGEEHQLGALTGCLARKCIHFLQGAPTIENNGGCLDDSHLDALRS